MIQATWRGYHAREKDPNVVSARKEIRARRAEDHIVVLRSELDRYYALQSSLQIQRSSSLDDITSYACTPDCTFCNGFYQNYLQLYLCVFFFSTEYKFTINVTQFALFQVLRDSTCYR